MPLGGTHAIDALLEGAPRMASFDAEPWEIPGVEVLHLTFEIDDRAITSALPPALHPVIPPVAYFSVARYPNSPAGAFTLAQLRIGARASALPRGFLLQAYCDSPAAAEALAGLWGYRVSTADVRLQRYHDRITGAVTLNGREILRVAMNDPQPISGGDVQYVANMHIAHGPDGPALVQVDPGYTFHRAERGTPEIAAFARDAWRAEEIEPVWPVVASAVLCDTGFPRIRYVLDPAKPAIVGTRKIHA
jgi:hypothetical protein